MSSGSNQKKMRFPVGVSNYRKLITGNFLYVDKTLGIERILQEGEISIICRPRRFGKTLFMSMLQHFFADNVDGFDTQTFFQHSLISEFHPEIVQEHQGQYKVIFLTFKDLKYDTYELAYQGIKGLFVRLYEQYLFLLDSPKLLESEKERFRRIINKTADVEETRFALKDLSHFLFKAYEKQVIILIDEYDTPILSGYLHHYYKEIIASIRGILSAALKDNPYVTKTVITGIIRVAKENLFSDLNNTEVYSILNNSYGNDFGFTEKEVNYLLEKTEVASQADEIKHWYNGYQIGAHTIYNPWSIISCLKNLGIFQTYWINTSGNELIKKVLSEASANVKKQLEQLMQGESIIAWIDEHVMFENLSQNETALWSLLFFSGYLTAQNIQFNELGYYSCELRIPNHEVLILYRKQLVNWFEGALGLQNYYTFISHLLTGKIESFSEELNRLLENTMSYFDIKGTEPEKFYHGLVLGLIATLHDTYRIYSNRESGLGRYDVALIPNDKNQMGLVIEFKTIKSANQLENEAKQALQQIKTKLYSTELSHAGITQVLQLGMAFAGKQVAIAYHFDKN